MRPLGILVLAALLTGQAFTQDPTAVQSTRHLKAIVYVYRYKQFVGAALEPAVYGDEAELARMDNGRYFAVKMDPGKHTFRSNDRQSGIDLDLKAGQEYFIRVEIATGFMKGHGRLILVAAQQGSYELKSDKLNPLDRGKVVDKTRVSVDVAHPEPTVVPASAAPVQAVSPMPQPQSAEHPISGETISDPNGALNSQIVSGSQVSLGEAARRARQKKDPPNQ